MSTFEIKLKTCAYFEIIEKYIKENKQFIDINHNVIYDMNDLILNLIIYTDGVQVTKSPSTSIWPVVCGLI